EQRLTQLRGRATRRRLVPRWWTGSDCLVGARAPGRGARDRHWSAARRGPHGDGWPSICIS
uniref:Uncharacterized protein n=1 Tax=Aegilops tauschii subsp. strangulata TaxID=200361 RepID=A0A453KQ23_AEGTS